MMFCNKHLQLLLTLCQYKHIKEFIQIGQMKQELKVLALKNQIGKLDELNRNTLMAVVNFMRRFIELKDFNKMNTYNICLMFAPNIFRDGNLDPTTTFTLTQLHISNMMVLVD